ncbi:protocadherin-1-like isoform X2 [Symsagittifera roscoffensis]|uniref:protocadherin-1-like isoform X2 n=1 Tax=Symsagittifera roscoffensis TaxID=84072 RepID=UPI00307C34F7
MNQKAISNHFFLAFVTAMLCNAASIVGQKKLNLPENSPIGFQLSSLRKLDIYASSNQEILLDPSEPFKISKDSKGELYLAVAKSIDREDSSLCKLSRQDDFKCIVNLDVILIFDNGIPESHRVNVFVEDQNDNVPRFDEKQHFISVPENADPSNSAFSIPYATDADSSEYAIRSYTLEPTDNSYFSLKVSERSDGVLIPKLLVGRNLDFEEQSSFKLTLIAKDPMNEGSMEIIVSIIDINDNTPVFEQSEQAVEILENDPIGKVVLQVQAKDEDSGKNGRIFYRFAEETLPEILEYFTIDETTGKIVLSKSLKSQGGQTLSVQVEARDGGVPPFKDLMTTEFVIKDVNDNKPTISFNPRSFWEVEGQEIYFSENEDPRMIGFFKITDEDPGVFGKTQMVQLNGTSFFTLHKIGTGMYSFSTTQTFDREEQGAYWVKLEASDCAVEEWDPEYRSCTPLKTSEVFQFNVGDVNDFKPRFEKYRYNYTIIEETEPKILDRIVVEDMDFGANGTVKFSIHSLQHEKWFHIDPDTGVFKILRKLDREILGSSVNVTIKAYDLGSPAKMSYKLFEITLIDIDDNQPKFNQSSYKFDILEGRGIGWEVGRVTAVDPDIDGCVRYYAADDDIYKAIFKVNETTGVIKTLRDFDYETEKQKEFYFEILAKACKKPEQVALARANIQLIDENDNSPQILKPLPNEEFSIPWDANPTYIVTQIRAVDDDFGRNAKLTYHISDSAKIFGVDPDQGSIIVKKHEIFRNRDRKIKVEIWVSDNGLERNERRQWNFIYLDGNETLFNHTSLDETRVAFLPTVPRFMIYAVCTIAAIVVLIIVVWLVLLIRLRSARSTRASTVKAQYSAVAGEAQLHRHHPHHNQYTLSNGTLARSQSPLGGSLASSGQGAFLKSSYPSPDAVAGGDSVSRGTPSPDDNNSGRVQGGNGTVASSSLHSSQLSTFNEKGGLLAPHPNPAGNGRYSANNTIDGRGFDSGSTLDRRRNYNPQYSGVGPPGVASAPPHPHQMIHYPSRSCHPSMSSPPPQYPAPGVPAGYQPNVQGDDLSAFQNRYAVGGPQIPYDSRYAPSGYESRTPQTLRNNHHQTFHPNRSPPDGEQNMNNIYATSGRGQNSSATPAPGKNNWNNNHVDDNSSYV